jgi:hypothetical protein
MNELIQLLARHGLMLLSGALAAHHFDNLNSTAGIVLAIAVMIITTCWSWVTKMLHLEDKFGNPSSSDALRTLLGALISQGITFASAYFAIDANDPNLLSVAAINALASRYGVHQQIAHATPLDVATAIKVFIACLCMLTLSSCVGVLAFLASPAGQVTLSLAELGLEKAVQAGKVTQGQSVAIKQTVAVVTDPNDSTVNKTFKLAELGLKAAADANKIKPGDVLLIQEATAIVKSAVTAPATNGAKQPVNVTPKNPVKVTMERRNRLKPELQNVPACLLSDTTIRRAAHDEWQASALPQWRGLESRGVSIPLYGERVAFVLITGEVK